MNTDSYNISAIIPFKDKASMTLAAVRSLLKYGPKMKEILLVSNGSSKSELKVISDALVDIDYKSIRIIEYNHPFNYQKINNWAVKHSTGELILFINNDTELVPESRSILEKMCDKARNANVGITGCLLLYGDRKIIQHAGVFLVPKGTADHLYVGKKLKNALDSSKAGDFPYDIREDRALTAVTGAVNVVERKKFDSVNGFDERFIIGGGDVDLCIRLNQAGFQTWYIAGGYIVHKESQSRAHKPITYNDFYYSYLSYITAYDSKVGDPFLSKITKGM